MFSNTTGIPAAADASAPRAKPLPVSQTLIMSGGNADTGGAGTLKAELASEVEDGADEASSAL